jgi:hypothetical protein
MKSFIFKGRFEYVYGISLRILVAVIGVSGENFLPATAVWLDSLFLLSHHDGAELHFHSSPKTRIDILVGQPINDNHQFRARRGEGTQEHLVDGRIIL